MEILYFEELDSTFTEAKRQIASGREPGFAVRAGRQTAARGRFDRPWQSPSGNLAITLVVRPRAPIREWASLALVTGLAIHRVLAPLVGSRSLKIKWPNDVLIDGAKVSGTLIESEGGNLLIGTGINVATAPANHEYPTVALSETAEVDAGSLAQAFVGRWLEEHEAWAETGFAALAPAYMARQYRLNETIRVSLDREKTRWIEGICRGVDEIGRVLVEGAEGRLEAHFAGDVEEPQAAPR